MPAGIKLEGALAHQGEALLGLRPEHLVPDAPGPITIDVDIGEQLGANTLLHGTLSGTDHAMVASVAGHVTTFSGAQHRFSAAFENLHLFDTETQKRLAG